jgi:hypothetical protein
MQRFRILQVQCNSLVRFFETHIRTRQGYSAHLALPGADRPMTSRWTASWATVPVEVGGQGLNPLTCPVITFPGQREVLRADTNAIRPTVNLVLIRRIRINRSLNHLTAIRWMVSRKRHSGETQMPKLRARKTEADVPRIWYDVLHGSRHKV